MAYKAKLRPKSPWQQDDCIGKWIGGCKNMSHQEAYYGKASVRCCPVERCVLFAITLAVDLGGDKIDFPRPKPKRAA
jgi:hypothetical protein